MAQQEADEGPEPLSIKLRPQIEAMTSLGVSVTRKTRDCPEALYHYTDTNALMGMVDNNEIWATNASYLNDESELVWAHRVFCDALDALSAQNANEAELFQRMKQAANEIDPISDIYLCSFSESLDDLTQWRAYGQGTGPVCINFRSQKLGNKFPGCELLAVIYERSEQDEIAKTLVDMVVNFYRRQASRMQ